MMFRVAIGVSGASEARGRSFLFFFHVSLFTLSHLQIANLHFRYEATFKE